MDRHKIRWAILPHPGEMDHGTVRATYNLNHFTKLMMAKAARPFIAKFPARLKGDEPLVLITVKRGEGDEDISTGRPAQGIVETVWEVSKVYMANLLEDGEEEVLVPNGTFLIDSGSFQVAIYHLCLAG
ncbi:hypothetical protein N7448_007353 [Penicillium atrosanguineum]|uniref:Uncharacterized protein n=1 Tax=Penicillium atrosanguineum TaxID=1132637 RepID=A0A9W9QDX3_9EURO|nr:uncharacterized protein N7443_001620 [Penicillium atrosanguineum]KAJ5126574.1 hypothetical protein N7448_007353 [Penicillium atrosanguineum]KAJ5146774.1 hypothetical protein N7526_000126 [Penicillium atrosanguineum]KAJ5314736.1 hypothetical protein N7443_001620 [Penicillium atrosanguineum]KAJ5331906.1 hypothetical protein N7476_001689 [Penicillium atrosanguineum]